MNIKQSHWAISIGSAFSCYYFKTWPCSFLFPSSRLRRNYNSTSPITLFLPSSITFEVHTLSSPNYYSENANLNFFTILSPTRSIKCSVIPAVEKAMWNCALRSS